MAQRYKTTAIQSEGTIVEVSTDAARTWQVLLGASSVSVSGGEADTREVRDLADVPEQLVSRPGIPTVSIPVGIFNPALKVHRDLKTAKDAGEFIWVRWQTLPRTIREWTGTPAASDFGETTGNEVQVAISDAGVLTFTGPTTANLPKPTDRYFRTGIGIEVGGTVYIVNDIENETDTARVTVIQPSGEAVAAEVTANSAFKIVKPGLRRPGFICRIVNFENEEIGEQSMLSTSLELQPQNALPNYEVHTET